MRAISKGQRVRRELLVALLMHEGWGMGDHEVVATIPPSLEIES